MTRSSRIRSTNLGKLYCLESCLFLQMEPAATRHAALIARIPSISVQVALPEFTSLVIAAIASSAFEALHRSDFEPSAGRDRMCVSECRVWPARFRRPLSMCRSASESTVQSCLLQICFLGS